MIQARGVWGAKPPSLGLFSLAYRLAQHILVTLGIGIHYRLFKEVWWVPVPALQPQRLKLAWARRSSRLQDWALVSFKAGRGDDSISNWASPFQSQPAAYKTIRTALKRSEQYIGPQHIYTFKLATCMQPQSASMVHTVLALHACMCEESIYTVYFAVYM